MGRVASLLCLERAYAVLRCFGLDGRPTTCTMRRRRSPSARLSTLRCRTAPLMVGRWVVAGGAAGLLNRSPQHVLSHVGLTTSYVNGVQLAQTTEATTGLAASGCVMLGQEPDGCVPQPYAAIVHLSLVYTCTPVSCSSDVTVAAVACMGRCGVRHTQRPRWAQHLRH